MIIELHVCPISASLLNNGYNPRPGSSCLPDLDRETYDLKTIIRELVQISKPLDMDELSVPSVEMGGI